MRGYINNRLAEIEKYRAENAGRMTPEQIEALATEEAVLHEQQARTTPDRVAWTNALLDADFHPREIENFLLYPEKMNTPEVRERLAAAGILGTTPNVNDGFLPNASELLSDIGDLLKQTAGVSASGIGEIDPVSGDYIVRPGGNTMSLKDKLWEGTKTAIGTTVSAATWPVLAAGTLVNQAVISPFINTGSLIVDGFSTDEFSDLSDFEKQIIIRNQIAEEEGVEPGAIDLKDKRIAERIESHGGFWTEFGRSARHLVSFGMWETEADRMAEVDDQFAAEYIEHKEGVVRKISNLKDLADRYPDNPERSMAMVTRDEYGFPQAFSREEIMKDPELARRFYQDRPRVLIHGKASGQAGSTAFDVDSMAEYGNTISIFRDGSQSLEDQAQDVNRQLLEINAIRQRFGWTPEKGEEAGFNIAAHSMGNPALLHLLAGGDTGDFPNVFRAENGAFRYHKDDLNIIAVAPAVGSNVANIMHSSGAGGLRAWDGDGADAPATHDLREQNYDRLTAVPPDVNDPEFATYENYRLAREQMDSILAGTRPGGYIIPGVDNDPTAWIFGPMFQTNTHDILVERQQIYDVFRDQKDRIQDIHLNHQDQIVQRTLVNAPQAYFDIDGNARPMQAQPDGTGRVNFIANTWSQQRPENQSAALPNCSKTNCWTPAASPPKIFNGINWPGSPFKTNDRTQRSYAPTFNQLPPDYRMPTTNSEADAIREQYK